MVIFFIPICFSLIEPKGLHNIYSSNSTLYTFDQLIDHDDESKGTFKQRYYELLTHNREDKSVILFIGGESDNLVPRGEKDFTGVIAEKFGSIVIVLEHRFFGESLPYSIGTFENLSLLTVHQALEDLVKFREYYTQLKGLSKAKWILVGGSYPGLLSAFARAKYPQFFDAAISSSGVVYANDNYGDFDLQIGISMNQKCAAVARQARRKIDELLKDPESTKWLLDLFNSSQLEPRNFPFVVGEMFSLSPQYGFRSKVCGALEDTLITGEDPVMALARYAREFFIPKFCDNDVYATYSDASMSTTQLPNGPRSWLWMTCNELAYWQVNPGRLGLRSPTVNQEFFEQQCNYVFGQTMHPNTTSFNEYWKPYLESATHIYFTTGSQDPWTPVCITEDWVPKDCYAHTITGTEVGHCSDLGTPKPTDTIDLQRTRIHMLNIIDQWIS